MKKMPIIFIILTLVVFSGCQQNNSYTISPSISDTTSSQTTTVSQPAEEDHAIDVSFSEDNITVLDNGIDLKTIESYLHMKKLETFENKNENYWKIYNGDIEAYNCKDDGIRLFRVKANGNPEMDFVECDPNSVTLFGVQATMNFTDIQNCIGLTEVVRVEHGFPGVVSFELRYIINGIKLKFVSWDESGIGWNMKFVASFKSGNDYIRITTDQINEYFSMGKDDLITYMGGAGRLDEQQQTYTLKGFKFAYYENMLIFIENSDQYEIAGIRSYFTSTEIGKILGDKEIDISGGGEDPFDVINYDFENFTLEIVYDYSGDEIEPFSITCLEKK